jgi:hypothetical protein
MEEALTICHRHVLHPASLRRSHGSTTPTLIILDEYVHHALEFFEARVERETCSFSLFLLIFLPGIIAHGRPG